MVQQREQGPVWLRIAAVEADLVLTLPAIHPVTISLADRLVGWEWE